MSEDAVMVRNVDLDTPWYRQPQVQLVAYDSGRVAVMVWKNHAPVAVESGAALRYMSGWVEVASVTAFVGFE